MIGDGECDGRVYNTTECGLDAGDSYGFNEDIFRLCNVENPCWCCGRAFKTTNCGIDGRDCFGFKAK